MVWYGMVWYGMVWSDLVWYGMVWYGMVWYGMVWYGMCLDEPSEQIFVYINQLVYLFGRNAVPHFAVEQNSIYQPGMPQCQTYLYSQISYWQVPK